MSTVTGGAGASLPYVSVHVDDAVTNGTRIGPSYTFNELADEATRRRAVTLSRPGDFVEFVVPMDANSIVVRYSIPNGVDGAVATAALPLSVDGVPRAVLPLTTAYSWYYGAYPFTNTPGPNPHHFFDDVAQLLPDMRAGSVVRLELAPDFAAESVTIDVADFERVAPPAERPDGFVPVTDFGADPTGAADSTDAFTRAVAAGLDVWIPPGTFRVDGHLILDDVTIRGAGIWHSVVTGQEIGFYGKWSPEFSRNVHLSHFQIRGDVRERVDNHQVNGIGGALSDSTVSDIWIEHTKVGAWIDGPCDNLHFSRMRIRNQTADGMNFHRGVTRSSFNDSHFRNLGDDGMAMWTHAVENVGNTFARNTVETPILANGIAIYGGRDITVTDNLVVDAGLTEGGGIHLANRFESVPVAGTIRIERNTLVRCGSIDPRFGYGIAAIWFDAREAPLDATVIVDDLLIEDSPFGAIQFINGDAVRGVDVRNVRIDGTGTCAVQLQVPGTATFTDVVATDMRGPAGVWVADGVDFTVVDGGDNSGWDGVYDGPWPDRA
ncbi:MAG: coagulation factor 5/8 type domain protein [Frankiales bacterium]|nr:coagulation factor 5/8 type domain protein [Frankiales bacterium]